MGRHEGEKDMKIFEGFSRDDDGEDHGEDVQEHEVEIFDHEVRSVSTVGLVQG